MARWCSNFEIYKHSTCIPVHLNLTASLRCTDNISDDGMPRTVVATLYHTSVFDYKEAGLIGMVGQISVMDHMQVYYYIRIWRCIWHMYVRM